jgi:hypothetical protein
MNLEQAVLEKLRQLPIDKQQEVLDFAEFIHQKMSSKRPPQESKLRSIKGLWANLDIIYRRRYCPSPKRDVGKFPNGNL